VSRRLAPALSAGARVAVVSPASPFARDEFDAGVAEIARLGFVPVYDDSVFAREASYLSGSAELRARAFMRHWTDPGVAALIAVRGGFGSAHLLPLLDKDLIVRTPKLFIGYSDNTTLLSWLTCQGGLSGLHGPMLERRLSRGAAGYDERSFLALCQGGRGLVLAPDGMLVLHDGEAAGVLVGGTMTQLTASLGTPYAFDPPDGCILFLEDVNERPYRIDRMLTQLGQSGILSRAAGIVFGEMRGCDEPATALGDTALGDTALGDSALGDRALADKPADALTARGVIQRLLHEFTGPVVFGFPSGHTTGPCWTLPLGVQVHLSTRPHPSLLIEESPVA
jgi:muramoyltetrapeptide carboxypeptidase